MISCHFFASAMAWTRLRQPSVVAENYISKHIWSSFLGAGAGVSNLLLSQQNHGLCSSQPLYLALKLRLPMKIMSSTSGTKCACLDGESSYTQ